uniref:SpoIIIAH-like family protein n=1 Tax=Acetatifactor sp. TaxID=1872090 RepID=UPI0040559EDC
MKNLIKKNQLMITALAIMIAIAGYLQFAGENLEEEYLGVDEDAIAEVADNGEIISENYTAEGISEAASLDGLLDLSEEDLLSAGLTEIESLDSEVDVIMEDYLDEDMQVVDAGVVDQGLEVADVQTDTGSLEVADAQTTADSLEVAAAGEAADGLVAEVTPEEGEIPGEAVFTSNAGVAVLSEAKLLKEQTRAKNKETLMEIINSAGLTDEQKQEAVDSMVEMTEYAEQESAAEILLEAKGFSDVVVSINGDAVDVVVNAAELTDVQRAQIEDIVTRKTDISAENIVISTVAQ